MNKFKKIVFNILCNNVSGSVIKAIFKDRIPDIRWANYKFDTTGSGMRNSIVASIFWGFYEGAEIRFVEKYFSGDTDVIELGASSGIISAHILSKMKQDKTLVSVEANSRLSGIWKVNSGRHNVHSARAFLMNNAIHYDSKNVLFGISDNTTESRLINDAEQAGKTENIPAIKLHTVVDEYKMNDYSLFCDIEGAEVEILLNDKYALSKCKNIFIELHEAFYKQQLYSVNTLKAMIIDSGFELVDQYGHVYFFTHPNLPSAKAV